MKTQIKYIHLWTLSTFMIIMFKSLLSYAAVMVEVVWYIVLFCVSL